MTGIAESAKSRTPMIVLAAEVRETRSNFYVDQDALAVSVGAVPMRVESADDAVATAARAFYTALDGRRTVVLNLPLPMQAQEVPDDRRSGPSDFRAYPPSLTGPRCSVWSTRWPPRSVRYSWPVADRERPAAGRRRAARNSTATRTPPTSPAMRGRAPGTARATTVAQVDVDRSAFGVHREIQIAVTGGVAESAVAAAKALAGKDVSSGYRSEKIRQRIATAVRWRDVPYDDTSTSDRIDPRTLTIALDDLLPAERVVSVDSGNFMGYPSMFLSVLDERGFCFTVGGVGAGDCDRRRTGAAGPSAGPPLATVAR